MTELEKHVDDFWQSRRPKAWRSQRSAEKAWEACQDLDFLLWWYATLTKDRPALIEWLRVTWSARNAKDFRFLPRAADGDSSPEEFSDGVRYVVSTAVFDASFAADKSGVGDKYRGASEAERGRWLAAFKSEFRCPEIAGQILSHQDDTFTYGPNNEYQEWPRPSEARAVFRSLTGVKVKDESIGTTVTALFRYKRVRLGIRCMNGDMPCQRFGRLIRRNPLGYFARKCAWGAGLDEHGLWAYYGATDG